MAMALKAYGSILKETFTLFIKNEPLKLGGATAFFTLFALPPVLTILVQLLSLFIDPETIRQEMYVSLSDLFGREAVQQIISVIRGLRQLSSNLFSAVLLYVFLLFVATTVFKVIRSSINQVWGMPSGNDKKVITGVKDRLISIGVILITALLFSTGMLLETVEIFAGNFFVRLFPAVSGLLSQLLAFIISLFFIAVWFAVLFRYLNDSRPAWRVACAGGLFTSVLFSIGKLLLHFLLTYNNINNIYGASAAIVLLLLFVFYSAMILYFGAAFTKVWSVYQQKK